MSRSSKQIKQYERWILIGIVVLLIATFSVTGVTAKGCSGPRQGDDYGGTFEVAPGQTETVSHEEFTEVYRRYQSLYARVLGPSLRFAGELAMDDRSGRRILGTWMHLVQVAAARRAGYRVTDEEVRDAVRDLVARFSGGRSSGFTPERYDQVLDGLSRGTDQRITKADFETTVRELLLKDKYLGDLVALDRYAVDRGAAFQAWKSSRERVDLVFASVPAASFLAATKPDEETRSAVAANDEAFAKAVSALKEVRRLGAVVEAWRKANGDAWPADEAELLAKEPGRKSIGAKMPVDPWGAPYAYGKAGDAGRVTSAGPDGKAGTADDVTADAVKVLEALTGLRRPGDAARTWFRETKAWPAALADLTKPPPAADGKPPANAPLLEVPKDPWDHPYAWDAATMTVRSDGPDGQAGTADDLVATVTEAATTVPAPAGFAAWGVAGAKDAWGRPLATAFDGQAFVSSSAGADGAVGTDDDVKDGNGSDLLAYYAGVKRDFAIPRKREFEAVYVVPSLVSDEAFAAAWAKLKDAQPTETEAWDAFRVNVGSAYRVWDGEGEAAPAVDPADPAKGNGADLRRALKDQGKLPKDATGWPVPAPETFGDRKAAPAAGTAGLPDPNIDKLYKTYLEKGWRYVALRDQFFAKLLDGMLKKARDAAEAHQKWVDSGKAGAEPDESAATFAAQVAALQELQPGEADLAKGASFLTLYRTPEPLDRTQIEALPVLGYPATSSYLDPLKDGQYDVTPRVLMPSFGLGALRNLKKHAERDAELAEVRGKPEFWDRYVEARALDRAAKALEKARTALLPAPADPTKPAPAPSAADVAAKLKAFQDGLEAAAKAGGFEVAFDRTGLFVGSTAVGQRAPKAAAGASAAETLALRRRAYVRSKGYLTVSQGASPTGDSRPAEAGSIGRYVLRDGASVISSDVPTQAAYLVIVAEQQDPVPEEFHGKAFLSHVAKLSYDRTGEWQRGISLHDREGRVLQRLVKLYDDWESAKADYRISPNVDIVMPKDAGAAR